MAHRELTPCLAFTTVLMFGDMRTTSTDYIGGRNTRLESRDCSGQTDPASPTGTRYTYGPLRAIVFNVDLGYTFQIEPAASVYTAYQAGPLRRSGLDKIPNWPTGEAFRKSN